jgi:hypothetical protein
MAGLFGLFGNKPKYVDEVTTEDNKSTQNGGAYYLNADDAKSFGNVEFMRKGITIKRTFPKTLKGAGGEFIQEVSSMDAKVMGKGIVSVASTSNGNGSKPTATTTQAQRERRSADSSMDLFRQMAREMKQ